MTQLSASAVLFAKVGWVGLTNLIRYPFIAQTDQTWLESLLQDIAAMNLFFVKFMQVLSSNYQLSKHFLAFTNKLAYEQSEVDTLTLDELRAWPQFEFDEEPMFTGTSSLIYLGKYQGLSVILKIKRNGLEQTIEESYAFVKAAAWVLDRLGIVPTLCFVEVLEEVYPMIRDQCCFMNELDNMEVFQRRYKNDESIYIPKTFREFTEAHDHVLVMERIDGTPFSELTKTQKRDLCFHLSRFNMTSILLHNIYHGDLHPGNVFFETREGQPRISIIDFGLVGFISEAEKRSIQTLIRYSALSMFDHMAHTLLTQFAMPIAEESEEEGRIHEIVLQARIQDMIKTIMSTSEMINVNEVKRINKLMKQYNRKLKRIFFRLEVSLLVTDQFCSSLLPVRENHKMITSIFHKYVRHVF